MDAWRKGWIINIIFIGLILELFGTILSIIFEMILNLDMILLIVVLSFAISIVVASWLYLVKSVEKGKTLRALIFVLALQPIIYGALLWLERTNTAFVSISVVWFSMWAITSSITIYFLYKIWGQQR